MNFASFVKLLKPYTWRIFCTCLGLIAAISFLWLGFGKTALILLCCGVGYFTGIVHDKNIKLISWLLRWKNHWR